MSKENGIEVKVKNKSNVTITNVEFSTTERIEIINIDKLEPNKSKTEFLSMRRNKADGAYSLNFTRANGKKESISCGYYSKGGSLDHWVDFEIENDTTIVNFDAPIY